jgi:carboxyl-terminal processing protease
VRPAAGGLRVLGVPADSAAKSAGLRPGDVIIRLDGRTPRAPEDLEGEVGTEAVLRVRRVSGEVEEVRVRRAAVEVRNKSVLREASPRTVVLRIHGFGGDYVPTEVSDLMDRAFEYENLILDLRGNPGGAVKHLLHLLSFFIPEGTAVGTPVSIELAARYVAETGGDPSDAAAVAAWATDGRFVVGENDIGPYPGRVAVLIDGRSASASEVSSAALRECRGAVVIGQKSAGALLVSTFEQLPAGFAVQVPISDYITIGGLRPEGEGIEPDIEVAPRRGGMEDAVNAARQALEGG